MKKKIQVQKLLSELRSVKLFGTLSLSQEEVRLLRSEN